MQTLTFKNLIRRPGRTAALALLTLLLALSMFGGSVLIGSLKRGLNSLEARLGADIIVLPASAESKVSFQNLLLQGTAGAFYMDAGALDRVREVEGVALAAPQTFLASLKADCCAIRVQVIGIDPQTDFVVKPWIDSSNAGALGDMEVVAGCRVTADAGETLRIYDQNCHVTAKLAETGTGLDTAVYCNMDTMRALLKAAEDKGVTHKITSGGDSISAIYVKVKDGFDIAEVNNRLNGHVRRATAVRTRSMLTGVSDSLAGIARVAGLLIAVVWTLALVILLLAYIMLVRERRREFAVLRLLGASRKRLCRLMLGETALCSLLGGLAGVVLASLVVFPFSRLIESRLGLPYLSPDPAGIVKLAILSVAATVWARMLGGSWAAWRLSRTDVGTTLREGT